MKNKFVIIKKVIISILLLVFVLMAVSCSSKNIEHTTDNQGSNNNIDNNNNNSNSNNSDSNNSESKNDTLNNNNNELPPEVTEVPKQTAFDKDIQYLSEKGITLAKISPDATVTTEEFLSLMTKTHEVIGGEIDISMVNPNNNLSDDVKKMTLMGVYENFFIQDNTLDSILDYGTASYWFMKLHDSVQSRYYSRSDGTATTGDLLRRINVSNALNTWSQEAEEVKIYTIRDLTANETTLDQHLSRLLAAEMLVNAYEDINGDIKATEDNKFSDTDSIYAWKSNQLFFWPETDKFEPETLGRWEDWSFTSAIIYDSQIRLSLELEGVNVPYGAITSAMASFIRAYEDMEQNKQEEIIVLNERPYDWFVYQMETGEYSENNCMPSCIEMALRYQGLSQIPSAEKLRADNPMDGLGWHDVLAENVMKQYGLQFTDSFEIKLDTMLDYLDQGNVLYVMYWEPIAEYGHSVIIKGYWKRGDSVEFLITDPNQNTYGPFGYIETTMEAETMIFNMESHVPRYFIIPSGE